MNRRTNIFDKIGTLIPGYSGYQEREGRRECDRQLREQIADKLSLIENKTKSLIESAELSEIAQLEKSRKKINNLKDLIKYSPYGSSSFFSDSVIAESELENVYQLDLDVLETVDAMENITPSNDLKAMETAIFNIETTINKRNQFLKDRRLCQS